MNKTIYFGLFIAFASLFFVGLYNVIVTTDNYNEICEENGYTGYELNKNIPYQKEYITCYKLGNNEEIKYYTVKKE